MEEQNTLLLPMFIFPLPILAAILQTAFALRCVCVHSLATLGVTNEMRCPGWLFKKKSSLQKVLRPDICSAKSQSADWMLMNAPRGGEQCLGPAGFLVDFE